LLSAGESKASRGVRGAQRRPKKNLEIYEGFTNDVLTFFYVLSWIMGFELTRDQF
jgi:hypothetical protein